MWVEFGDRLKLNMPFTFFLVAMFDKLWCVSCQQNMIIRLEAREKQHATEIKLLKYVGFTYYYFIFNNEWDLSQERIIFTGLTCLETLLKFTISLYSFISWCLYVTDVLAFILQTTLLHGWLWFCRRDLAASEAKHELCRLALGVIQENKKVRIHCF